MPCFAGVAGHAENCVRPRARSIRTESKMVAQRIGPTKVGGSEAAIDHDAGFLRMRVAWAARKNRNLHGRKVAIGDITGFGCHLTRRIERGVGTGEGEGVLEWNAWQSQRRGRRLNAGQRTERLQCSMDVLPEFGKIGRFGVTAGKTEGEDVTSVETGRHLRQLAEASQQESRHRE